MRVLMATAPSITIGDQPTFKVFGLTFDTYVIVATLVAAAIVLLLGWRARSTATSGVPGKLQLFFEFLIEQVSELTDSVLGEEGYKYLGIGVMLFFFILVCNWLEFVPSTFQIGVTQDILPAPTSDVNLPLAMALTVFFYCQYLAFKRRGFGGYFKHYTKPLVVMTPINVIEEITKPITLTFRLFGNVFAGGLLIVVVAVVGQKLAGQIGGQVALFLMSLIWRPFDTIFIGAIQALIFALLTIMYIGMSTSVDAH
ncbi:MAG TPA: F0F1 ATP synthase subunit A [Acidimicrobiales bacterium]|nr:F0F1 ATP synthase subunit A [Acidimicrobiales bacterium]